MPNCSAFIERWNRTIRQKLLDHPIIIGERDLRRLPKEQAESRGTTTTDLFLNSIISGATCLSRWRGDIMLTDNFRSFESFVWSMIYVT
jgi:hypothetical protein